MQSKVEQIFTIPNILTLYRLLLAPILYLSISEGMRDVTLLVFILSGVSDLLDGFFARHMGQVSDLGKILDPVADKLTYFFILLGLSEAVSYMRFLLIFLIIKESLCSITSLLSIRQGTQIHGARLHGKITSSILFATVLFHLLFVTLAEQVGPFLVGLCLVSLAISCALYVREHIRAFRRARRSLTEDFYRRV